MEMVDTKEGARSTPKPQRTRRTHSAEFKASVVRACGVRGVSLASVAMAHGVNANLVRRWCIAHQRAAAFAPSRPAAATLIPVTVEVAPPPLKPAPAARRADPIDIEVFGARIVVRPGFDVPTLHSVITVLRETLAR